MVKVNYKKLSPEMEALAAPSSDIQGRSSIGLEKQVGEYYFLDSKKLLPYKNQARKAFNEEELTQLALTIKEHGIRQPLTVIPSDQIEGCFEVVSGERRLRAAALAGLTSLPCIIIKDHEKAEEISLIENIQRSDLHPVELGDAYQAILNNKKYGAITDLAEKIGKSISSISEYSRLSKLPSEIKHHLIEHNIRSKTILRKLASVETYEEMKALLGLASIDKIKVPKNILHVSFDSQDFKIVGKSIAKLSQHQKKILKDRLIKFIESL